MRDAVGAVRTVLVLGATSDLARAIAWALVERGARAVALGARAPADLELQAERLRAAGCEAWCFPFDAVRPERHAGAIADAFDAVGDIDLVLVAFGMLGDGSLDPDGALEVASVNYVGAVSAILQSVRRLEEQGHGTIVVLSSVAAERPRASNAVYASSKAGLDAFAQGLGHRLAASGLRVVVVRPGFVRTKMTAGRPSAPMATTPEAVAAAVVRGLERGSEIVWVPPAIRWVMLLLRALPRPLFRRLPL